MNRLDERKDSMNDKSTLSNTEELFVTEQKAMQQPSFMVKKGEVFEPFNSALIAQAIDWARAGYEDETDNAALLEETIRNCFDGINEEEITDAMILAAVAFIERDPAYGYVSARLLFKKLFREVTTKSVGQADIDHEYAQAFIRCIKTGVEHELFDKRLLEFDLETLAD
jgi:ribonucleoside-diphosphate reductase alpha chain